MILHRLPKDLTLFSPSSGYWRRVHLPDQLGLHHGTAPFPFAYPMGRESFFFFPLCSFWTQSPGALSLVWQALRVLLHCGTLRVAVRAVLCPDFHSFVFAEATDHFFSILSSPFPACAAFAASSYPDLWMYPCPLNMFAHIIPRSPLLEAALPAANLPPTSTTTTAPSLPPRTTHALIGFPSTVASLSPGVECLRPTSMDPTWERSPEPIP